MRFVRSAALVAAFSLLTLPMLADTTYTYTGNDFVEIVGSTYTQSDSISGTVTFASPLGDSLAFGAVTPVSFSLTDGVHLFTNTNNTYEFEDFDFSTDNLGNIATWRILLEPIHPGPDTFMDTTNIPASSEGVLDEGSNFSGSGENQGNAGTWAPHFSEIAPVPEPSSLALLGTGVLGLVGAARRRFVRS